MKHHQLSSADPSIDVSRETLERLHVYLALLLKWNTHINLVGRDTESHAWVRHFADSLQLLPYLPDHLFTACDLGSGGGFPGLVLAIATGRSFHLVEADHRKAAFLREVAHATGADVTIHVARAEAASFELVDLLTARAFAPLTTILRLGEPRLRPSGMMLLLKGAAVAAELTDARRECDMKVERFASVTDPRGTILRLTEVRCA